MNLLGGTKLYVIWIIYTFAPVYGDIMDNPVLQSSYHEAANDVDRAIYKTLQAIQQNRNPQNPAQLLRLFRFPSQSIVDVSRHEEVFETTVEIMKDHEQAPDLTPELVEAVLSLSGCEKPPITCEDMCFHYKYRTVDGTCNNFENPTQGAAMTAFSRMREPIYENDLNEPVGWNIGRLYNGFPKPSPRDVSNKIGSTYISSEDPKLTGLVTQFGQFLDHDLDITPQSPSSVTFRDGTPCSDICANDPPCFPIPVPDDDPRIHDAECTEFIRSSAVCGTGSLQHPREQTNAITSYIDASQVYGSNQTEAEELRDSNGKGGLRVGDNETATGRPLLPFDDDSPMACLSDDSMNEVPCFLAGDVRANEQIGLTAMHTLFLREHNRISNMLSQINPHWDDEQLYQETRKLVGATLQHITYDHYLPKILGDVGMESIGVYSRHDPRTNAAVNNVFSTAAFRFGHGTVKPILVRLNATFHEIPDGHLPLHLAFFQPWRIVEQGGIDPVIRGLFATAAKDLHPSEMLTDELTEHLFELSHTIALDLMSLNIQRGRDHALPGYTEWVELCNEGRHRITEFKHLKNLISSNDLRAELQTLYGHVDNIDLYIGGMAEDPIEGSVVGPTFNCILSRQFKNTRNGDRFWYEKPGYFLEAQLAEIKKTSLARIICDNTDIDQVQRDVFLIPDVSGGLVTCNDIEGIDLSAWTHQHDNTPLSIQCPDDITIEANHRLTRVTWPDVAVNDDSSAYPRMICSHKSGSRFSHGVTTVTCTATDESGYCASCSFSVIVERH
ncbi:peroxidasin-like [Saccoglossus kowalevskii]|uniref:Peroxidasin-like n=1 Tax=Saccoglossus kowalevskii TaxID=10224 RepID=A0ABM0GZW7_SACKO|nr:PREDICTED: peroxidasin-like [Saccoglossus kowalevskii]